MTVTALMASGVLDNSLLFHIQNAKACGVTKEEMAEILPHTAFTEDSQRHGQRFDLPKNL